mgnify:FL=1
MNPPQIVRVRREEAFEVASLQSCDVSESSVSTSSVSICEYENRPAKVPVQAESLRTFMLVPLSWKGSAKRVECSPLISSFVKSARNEESASFSIP